MKGKVTLTREQRFRKDMLIDRIDEATPAEDLEKLIEARAQKQMEKAKSASHRGQKCKRAPSVPAALLVESMAEADEVDSNSSNVFLELPTDAERKQCYAHFYDATSNTAVEHCICGVCARECGVLDDSIIAMPLSLMPNSYRLIPSRPHVAHDLYGGRLLDPEGIIPGHEDPIVSVCHQCLEELKKPNHKPPKMSLANGLWIGRIPWQLQVLTFPKQLLIALLYPRIYVFKLFPKCQQGGRNMALLQ